MIRLPIPSLTGLMTERLVFRRLVLPDVEWWMEYTNSAEAIRFILTREGCRVTVEPDGARAMAKATAAFDSTPGNRPEGAGRDLTWSQSRIRRGYDPSECGPPSMPRGPRRQHTYAHRWQPRT